MSNIDKFPRHLLYPYLWDLLLLLFIFVSLVVSLWLTILKYDGAVDWLQRSGSIVTLCSAIIEYRRFQVYSHPTQRSLRSGEISGVQPISRLARIFEQAGYFAGKLGCILLVLGALIWGYGDLPFKQ